MLSADPIGATMRPREVDDRCVYDLARVMFQKMRANAHKAHWNTVRNRWLLTRLREEVMELDHALRYGTPAEVEAECADVGNFAGMIADNARNRIGGT